MKFASMINKFALILFIVCFAAAAPWDLVMTTEADFIGGAFNNTQVIPDPVYPDAAVILNEFDTIKVLQITPMEDYCLDCFYIIVDSLSPFGEPPIVFKIEVTTLNRFNSISSLTNNFQVTDPANLAGGWFNRNLMFYDIIFFGIANGYGGRSYDLSNGGRSRVREFAGLGKGVILTHDTIARRRGWPYPITCTDMSNFEHERFNSITDVTGLGAEWVDCDEPDDLYYEVHRDATTPDSPILHAPFELPDTFAISACHEFGEVYVDGQVWFRSIDGRIFMHTYHSGTYGSYAAYFSTGHFATRGFSDWRPSAFEGKAMINSMYYAYYGGRGSGIYESPVFTAECPGRLTRFEIDADTPGEAIVSVELASSPDGTIWSDFYIVEPLTPIPALLSAGPFYKYRVIMQRGIYGDRPVMHSITWRFDLPKPELELVMPPLGSFYSCSCGSVIWDVHTQSGISVSSAHIEVNSTPYGSSRCVWNSADSTFSFLGPVSCWEHGVLYTGAILELAGETGCNRLGDTLFSFTADLRPPTITNFVPGDGVAISNTTPLFRVNVYDSTSGAAPSTFYWRVNGDSIGYGDAGLSWNGTTRELTLSTFIAGLSLIDSVTVCVGAGDNAIGCGPNMAETCFVVIIDTTSPVIELVSPENYYISCDSLEAIFYIWDLVGIDTSSLTLTAAGSPRVYPNGMSFIDDTLYLMPGIALSDGDTFEIVFTNLEDALGNNRSGDSWEFVADQSPPFVSNAVPPNGGFVGVSDPVIRFRLTDILSGVNADSIAVTVNGTVYTLPRTGITWDGSELVMNGSTLGWAFEHNDSIAVCVHSADNASGCGANSMDSCWFFNVNLRGPECVPISPLDGWVCGCNDFHIRFFLADPNGVDHSTIRFSVDGVLYNVSSSAVTLIGDTVDFTPPTPWTHGQVVRVLISEAEDSLGNVLETPCDYSFTVDLLPPVITPFSPPHNGVVDTVQPLIIALINDETGISDSGLVLCANDDCWGYDSLPPGLRFTGDSLIFDPYIAGHYFDTESVVVTVRACDAAQLCGPNCGDTSWVFFIDNLGPRAFLIEPESGTWSSCSTQGFAVRVVDPSGLIMDSIVVLVDGSAVRWPNLQLEYIFDTLIFTPDVAWGHLDAVTFELHSAYDSVGNPLQDTIRTTVFIDLVPPEIEIVSPLPGALDVHPLDIARTVVTDDGCGVNIDAVRFYLDGNLVPFSVGLFWSGDTLVFDPASAMLNYTEGNTAAIRITASDCAGYCPPNSVDTTWQFFVPDDDTIPPVWIDYSPALWLADSVFSITCRVFDSSGIYIADPPDPQSAYIIWDTDGELAATCDTAWLNFVSVNADTVTFETGNIIFSTDSDEDIHFIAICWDDDFDYMRADDRLRGDSPIWFIEIVAPANVEMVLPQPEWVTSCRDQTIEFRTSGEVALDMASCVFMIDGAVITTAHPNFTAFGDSLFVYTPSSNIFSDGAVYISLIEAHDELGNPLFVPIEWVFYVDTQPPDFQLLRPAEGQMVPDGDYGFLLSIFDNRCGINPNYIEATITVNSGATHYMTIDSAGLNWDGVNFELSFNAGSARFALEDGDSLVVDVCAGDNPDLCPPNIGCVRFSYWIEPHVECSTSTNPFTPNRDGFNDEVAFFWPHFYRDGATVRVFDMRGVPVKSYNVPAGKIEDAAWDGKNDSGKDCPGGVYVYIIEVSGKTVCKGSITLIR